MVVVSFGSADARSLATLGLWHRNLTVVSRFVPARKSSVPMNSDSEQSRLLKWNLSISVTEWRSMGKYIGSPAAREPKATQSLNKPSPLPMTSWWSVSLQCHSLHLMQTDDTLSEKMSETENWYDLIKTKIKYHGAAVFVMSDDNHRAVSFLSDEQLLYTFINTSLLT